MAFHSLPELTIPTSWHAGPHTLSPDLVNYFPRGIWLLIASYFNADHLIHALSDDKILALWVKQIELQVTRTSGWIQMRSATQICNPFGGPAYIKIYSDDYLIETWYENGERRIQIETKPKGVIIKSWYENNTLHRTDGPAYIETHPNGRRSEHWYKYDKYYRTDGPARIEIYPGGNHLECWYEDDTLHRVNGPAYTSYQNGRRLEVWYKYDKCHRIGGPARIETHPDGRRIETWYENDVEIPAP